MEIIPMRYTLVLLKHSRTTGKQWGDCWKLHARGCNHTMRSNVDWKTNFDTIDDAVDCAFYDFINEGMSMKEARLYLKLCPCAKKVIA